MLNLYPRGGRLSLFPDQNVGEINHVDDLSGHLSTALG